MIFQKIKQYQQQQKTGKKTVRISQSLQLVCSGKLTKYETVWKIS